MAPTMVIASDDVMHISVRNAGELFVDWYESHQADLAQPARLYVWVRFDIIYCESHLICCPDIPDDIVSQIFIAISNTLYSEDMPFEHVKDSSARLFQLCCSHRFFRNAARGWFYKHVRLRTFAKARLFFQALTTGGTSLHPEDDLGEVVTHVQVNFHLAIAHPVTKTDMADALREMTNLEFLSAHVYDDGPEILSDLAKMAPNVSESMKVLKLKYRDRWFCQVRSHRITPDVV